jgi:hypothetical protein
MVKTVETKGKKKKGEKMSLPDTATSAPLRGANQDYSGVNDSNDVADYTISDGFISGVGSIRATPIQMNSTPRGKREKNAPRNIGAMQRASDKRRMQLDRIAQKRSTAQKVAKEKMIKKRQAAAESVNMLSGMVAKTTTDKDKKMKNFKLFREEHNPVEDYILEAGLDEAIKLNSKVKIHAPGKSYHGEVGYVGEIRHGLHKDAPKTFTVDYGDRKSIQLGKENIRMHKEEVELDEVSKKTLGSYVKKAADDLAFKAYDAGSASDRDKGKTNYSKAVKRLRGIKKASDKLTKEEVELDEARRGRPRKGEGEDQESSNIIMQLRKVISLRGQAPVRFMDGKQSMMSPATAHRLLYMYDNLKTSGEKHSFAERIHKSADSLRDVLAGKKEVVKPKITLAGKFS